MVVKNCYNACRIAGMLVSKLCSVFKLDHKVLLPKPVTSTSYRFIKLESTTGLIFQRTIAYRLRWKLEASNDMAKHKIGFKNNSCVQSVVRVINKLQEAKFEMIIVWY